MRLVKSIVSPLYANLKSQRTIKFRERITCARVQFFYFNEFPLLKQTFQFSKSIRTRLVSFTLLLIQQVQHNKNKCAHTKKKKETTRENKNIFCFGSSSIRLLLINS